MLLLIPTRPLQAKSGNLDSATLRARSGSMFLGSRRPEANPSKAGAYRLALNPRSAAAAILASPGPTAYSGGAKLEYRRRHLPRWSEVLGMSLGLGAIIAGATFHAMDGVCLKKEAECSSRLDSSHLGRASWIAGTQIFVTSLVFLLIDEWPRSRRRAPLR